MDNEYEGIARELIGSPKENFSKSMYVASQRQPDEHAEFMKTAQKLKVSPDVITPNNFQDAKKMADQDNDYGALVGVAPKTTGWLSNPDNASIAKDDIQSLKAIEKTVQDHSFGENFYNTLASGMAGFNASILRIPDIVYNAGAYPVNKIIQQFNLPYRQLSSDQLYDSPAKKYEVEQQRLAGQSDWMSVNIQKAIDTGNGKDIAKYLAAQVIANAPQQAVSLAAAYAGMPMQSAVMMGMTTAGTSAGESQSKGVEPAKATEAAVLKGVTESLFENLGTLGLFKKWEGAIQKSLGTESYKEIITNVGKTLAHSFLGEGFEEGATSLVQDFTDYTTGNNPQALEGIWARAAESAAVGGLSGGLMTGPSAIMAGMRRHSITNKAENSKQFFLNLETQILEGKLHARMPEKAGEFVNETVAGTGAQNVYIEPEALTEYFQSKNIDPIAAMTNLGIIEKWNASKESGAPLEIPTGLIVEKLAGTEHFAALADHVKFNPEDLSVAQAKELAKQEQAAAEQNKADLAEQKAEQDQELKKKFNDQALENRKVIRNNIADQLVETGLYDKKQALVQATLYENFFGTLEANYGLDAAKLFEDFAPEIKKGTFQIPAVVNSDKGIDKGLVAKIKETIAPKDVPRGTEKSVEMPTVKYYDDGSIKYDLDVLRIMQREISDGELQLAEPKRDEVTGEVIGQLSGGSTFPDYFKDKGYTKKEALTAIEKAMNYGKNLTENQKIILDDLYKDAVDVINNQGQEYFQQAKGSYLPKNRMIKLAESRDLSTFIHESGHYFLDIMQQIENSGSAPEGFSVDYKTILDYVGSVDGNLETEHHEKFANAFENYLASGKSPSRALRRAFETFKNWLFSVYNGIRMHPGLNPEITAVFDRMLASHQEIEEYQQELSGNSVFSDGAAIGLKGKQLERYNELIPEIKIEAQDRLQEIALEKANKKLAKEYKEQEKHIRSIIEEQADKMPVFQVIDQIENDEYGAINRADVEQFGQKFVNEFPAEFMKKNGGSAQVLADIHYGGDLKQMLEDMTATPDKDEFIKKSTDAEMEKLFPELQPMMSLSRDAIEALHNEKKAELLSMQAEQLRELANGLVKGVAKNLIARMPSSAVVKAQARDLVMKTKTSEIKPKTNLAAEKKFSKMAAAAYGKDDYAAAYEAKKKEYLNFELFVAATAAQKQIKKDIDFFKKLRRSDEDLAKTREMNYINVARAVLKLYDMGPAKKTVSDYLETLKAFDEDTYNAFSQLIAPIQDAAKPADQATFAEWQDMTSAVENLWDMAKTVREFRVAGEVLAAETVASDLIKDFELITKEKKPKKYTEKQTEDEKKKAASLAEKAGYRRFESWVNGITTAGTSVHLTNAFNYMFRPISESDTTLRLKINETNGKLRDIFEENKDWFKDNKTFMADEIGHNFHKDDIVMALLHSGNESNLRKLLVGRGWGSIDAESGVLDRSKFDAVMARARKEGYLTKEVYQMAQKIWDLMDSMNPDTQKAFKIVNGYYYGMIKSAPFTNEFGSFSGGYIPAKLDPALMKTEQERKMIEKIISEDAGYVFPSKKMQAGFSKDRNENYHGPLSLDFNLLGSHIDGVLKFTYMEPARKQMQTLLKNKELVAAINAFDEHAVREIIEPFLDRAKEQKIIVPSTSTSAANKALQRFSSWMRNTATVQIMTGLVSSSLQQFTGFSVAKTKFMGDQKSHLSQAFRDYLSSPSAMVEKAIEMSEWYKSDIKNNNFEMQKEIEDIILDKSDFRKLQEYAKKNAYFLQKATQNIVSTVVWHAGYNQYFEHNPTGSQADAVTYADAMVRTTQGTNNPIDVSAAQVVTPMEALYTQFTGYFNMVYNLKAEQYERIEREAGFNGSDKDPMGVRRRKFMVYMTASALPALIIGQLLRVLGGRPFDQDGDGVGFDDLMSAIGLPLIGAEINMLPVNPLLKQAVNLTISNFNKIPNDDRMGTPGQAIIEKGAAAGADAYKMVFKDANNRKALVGDVLSLVGVVTSLPLAPLAKPINYLADVQNGKAQPTGPVDFLRGMVTGAPGGTKK